MEDGLPMWTIYKHPPDAPGEYVVRRYVVRDGATYRDRVCFKAPTLDEARAIVPPGLYCMPRSPEDDPVVVETWL